MFIKLIATFITLSIAAGFLFLGVTAFSLDYYTSWFISMLFCAVFSILGVGALFAKLPEGEDK